MRIKFKNVALFLTVFTVGFTLTNCHREEESFKTVVEDERENLTLDDILKDIDQELVNSVITTEEYLELSQQINSLKIEEDIQENTKKEIEDNIQNSMLSTPEIIKEKVERYKELKEKFDGKLSDDTIEYYCLTENLYIEFLNINNYLLSNGYEDLSEFGITLAKAVVMDVTRLDNINPDNITLPAENELGKGAANEIIPVINYKDDETNTKYILTVQETSNLNEALANVYYLQKNITNKVDGSYNKDRIDLFKRTLKNYKKSIKDSYVLTKSNRIKVTK